MTNRVTLTLSRCGETRHEHLWIRRDGNKGPLGAASHCPQGFRVAALISAGGPASRPGVSYPVGLTPGRRPRTVMRSSVSTGAACPCIGGSAESADRTVLLARPAAGDRRDAPDLLSARPTQECSREQAHLPAQQPAPAQEARLPPAYAHACRTRHPGQPSRQGPSAPGRLTGRPEQPACCRRAIGSDAARTSMRSCEAVVERAGPTWSSTCCSPTRMPPRAAGWW
jgi:hypothetical protein